MKIECLKENLSKGLNIISKITPIRASLPILSNVLLKTEKGRLKLSGTNLEIGINYFLGAKIEKEGAITVPVKILNEYINSLPENKINLTVDKLQLLIESKNYQTKIFGMDPQEFPLIPEIKEDWLAEIEPKQLLESINQVSFATTIDESRPILSGVYFNFNQNKLTMVGTDSYRLSEKIINLSKKFKKDFSIIVPSKTINEIFYIISEFNEPIKVALSENQVLFKIKDIEVVSKLIEGEFPNYQQIIPDSYETRVKINTEEFIQLVKMANIFAREGIGNIKLEIKNKGEITISVSTASLGEHISHFKAEVEGLDTEINFNTKYLLDALNSLRSEEFYLELNGKLNPGLIKPVGKKGYLHIIMPLRA